MKLASALAERADIQTRLEELSDRLTRNAKVQEGDHPAEDPQMLLEELSRLTARLKELIVRINLTNSTVVVDGETITALLARRDTMQTKLDTLKRFLSAASSKVDRYSKTEIRVYSTVNVRELQEEVDRTSQALRAVNDRIQELNWLTDLQ